MQEFTSDDIIAHHFTSGRRKGYDTLEVDGYLERLAEYVGWMQRELALHQATERSALDVLLQAQRVADETVATAQRDADKIRQNAADGMENARKDARAVLETARAEADSTLLSARTQAEADVERSRSQIAEIEATAAVRADEINQLIEELRSFAAKSASQLRSAGSHLVEMAHHFDFEIASRGQGFAPPDGESVVLDEECVELDAQRVEIT